MYIIIYILDAKWGAKAQDVKPKKRPLGPLSKPFWAPRGNIVAPWKPSWELLWPS